MKEECLICGAPLRYLEADREMECVLCHTKGPSKTVCEKGHYVCSECHTKGMDAVIGVWLSETSKNPAEILQKLTALPFCHMHGPEHHVMVGSALLTAYRNAGGELNLGEALTEMQSRGKKVPGGAIGEVGGPRCCKRDSYLAITQAAAFARTHLGVEMELGEIRCVHAAQNNQCIGKRCPFAG